VSPQTLQSALVQNGKEAYSVISFVYVSSPLMTLEPAVYFIRSDHWRPTPLLCTTSTASNNYCNSVLEEILCKDSLLNHTISNLFCWCFCMGGSI